jgi:glutamine synthetase
VLFDLFGVLLRNERAEWADYRCQVTEYERRRYVAIV